jgi:asparagine synthase (glutamine-hydrolysing)
MCGIAGIISKRGNSIALTEKLLAMSEILKHRGPDGEGFLLVKDSVVTPVLRPGSTIQSDRSLPYLPVTSVNNISEHSDLGFAHRRLSIIDLTPAGHQPMCDHAKKAWITFNGEIYNYRELRAELQNKNYRFQSTTDTEVVLNAYLEWGKNCVQRFNGMWSFCIYDVQKDLCFASRDRLGVKPFYFYESPEIFAFASEQKAFIKSGLLKASVSERSISNYLGFDVLENETANFFEGITELFPGHSLTYDLKTHRYNVEEYFEISRQVNLENERLSDAELSQLIRQTFDKTIELRLRSDVEVGTCLSGGIDSSAIATTMAALSSTPIHCFTSVFRSSNLNEEKYADAVASQINARHHKIEPRGTDFFEDVNDLIYAQDVPIWSTSTYAQHRVMGLARHNGIKVVLDGQGADELFAGYHHHYLAQWKNLLSRGEISKAISAINTSSKTIPKPFLFFAKQILKERLAVTGISQHNFFKEGFFNSTSTVKPFFYSDVNEQLIDDIGFRRLKIFLKCEDRCGMWHSVESRTPFSDDPELIKLAFSFDGNRKIKNGISKYLLREALKDRLPAVIYQRTDKMGFETPMEEWVWQNRKIMMEEVLECSFTFLNNAAFAKADLRLTSNKKLLFKLFILSRWKKVFGA